MADDGLLVNFEIPQGTLATKSVLRGGPWSERRRIRQQENYHTKKRLRDTNTHIDSELLEYVGTGTNHESKRRKTSPASEAKVHAKPFGGPKPYHITASPREPRTGAVDKPIISSLFSSNPESKTTFDDKPIDPNAEPVEPSNAPLSKELLNFTTLGLTPAIAAHLTSKLAISAPTSIQRAAIPTLLNSDEDAFIQAETGSGKTLAYLLPIVQRIMALSRPKSDAEDGIARNSGLFAIILAPTRELSKQISVVLESLLRRAHWIVAGAVLGGESKKSEKARIRKGFNILVATPGRLADHLEHTEALDTSSVRWLVLDEGDRLVELGFEDDIKKIISKLDFRLHKSQGKVLESLPKKRVTILCSATMRTDVERLGTISLKDAAHIAADPTHTDPSSESNPNGTQVEKKFSVPSQLKQSYVIVPAKLRLVTLIASLKRAFIRCKTTTKVIVFVSCADSVDFHFQALTRNESNDSTIQADATKEAEKEKDKWRSKNDFKAKARASQQPNVELGTSANSPSLSTDSQQVSVFRLHGSLQQSLRTSTLQAFSKSSNPSLLLCTDIASRGLDLPDVDRIIEYDPAFSREEHLHRVGRTARAGNEGAATIFLQPGCEEGYVDVLKAERGDLGAVNLRGMTAEAVLRAGFPTVTQNAGRPRKNVEELQPWEVLATDFQLAVERWALAEPGVLEAARRAFQSHIRAYATHVKDERQWFDMKQLHLGHLAKAFALRDRPGSVNVPGLRVSAGKVKADRKQAGGGAKSAKKSDNDGQGGEDADIAEARRKMSRMGRSTGGASEFNLA
ncbi:DEAD-domain-containing protein [Microthyrium microscopicum]|uniref:ATP-dependent RNA helicase n=1 Tax=Microthyrium microscopicum TaxID=703497 RepID=A0A6A6ULE1_9PEZI|nr:DEAD-domain-containing protein [Microthyrium microscopicum]